jgi:branched-chain amino acid transport system permease protein
MIREFKKIWKTYAIGMAWLLGLLWPLLGIHPDGTLSFANAFEVWLYILIGTSILLLLHLLNKSGYLALIARPVAKTRNRAAVLTRAVPPLFWWAGILVMALVYPSFTGRYAQDVAILVLIYICLGLGLNIVVGLAGMLDLGYIAFYGVGA